MEGWGVEEQEHSLKPLLRKKAVTDQDTGRPAEDPRGLSTQGQQRSTWFPPGGPAAQQTDGWSTIRV